MKLSFIIPAYNEQNYIGKCLESIQKEIKAHAETEIEIIVVNNNSTDQTAHVASLFSGVKVVNEARKGIIFARQAGVAVASGELLAHIDADTILPSGWLKKVLEEFSKDPKLIALSGPFIYYDLSAGVRFGIKIYFYFAYFLYLLSRFVFRIGSMLQGGNFVVKKQAWLKLAEYDKAFNFYGEDIDLARRLFALGPVKYTLSLPMYTSARRIAKEGLFTMTFRYPLNYFWVMYLKRPFTKSYRDIR